MTILVNHGTVYDITEPVESKKIILSREDLEYKIAISARDGENLDLIKLFAKGAFSSLLDNYSDLVKKAINTAYLNNHPEVIKTIFESNKECFNYVSKYALGYSEIEDIHNQVTEASSLIGDFDNLLE